MRWPEICLEDLLEDIQPGFASGQNIDDGVLQIRMNNVKPDGSWDWSKERRVPATSRQLEKYSLQSGDILFNATNSPEQVGKSALFKQSDEPVTFSNHFLRLRVKKNKVDESYLIRYFASLWKKRVFENMVDAWVNQATVQRDSFLAIQIPIPPLPEQKRIAAILDKADSLRRKNQQAIQLADKFLRAVFLDMFGDPVTNPKGWEVKNLKDQIVHANNGLSRRRKETENKGDIVLRLQDIQYDGIQFDKELNRINLEDKERLRYKLDVDDILFIRVNGNPDYVGRSAVFKGYIESVYHNDHLIRIKIGKAYNPEFLSYCLNFKGSRKIISTQIKTSAGQYTISQGGIEKLEFFRPPIELQNKFIAIRNHALNIPHHKIDDGSLFNALSQKAFAGEI